MTCSWRYQSFCSPCARAPSEEPWSWGWPSTGSRGNFSDDLLQALPHGRLLGRDLHCRAHPRPGGATLVGILPAVSRGLGVHDPPGLALRRKAAASPEKAASPRLPLWDDGRLSLQRLFSDG